MVEVVVGRGFRASVLVVRPWCNPENDEGLAARRQLVDAAKRRWTNTEKIFMQSELAFRGYAE